jgi:hypothetical protein
MARTGMSSKAGKCGDHPILVNVQDELRDALSFLAIGMDKPLGEYCREVLAIHVYGKLHVVKQRISVAE